MVYQTPLILNKFDIGLSETCVCVYIYIYIHTCIYVYIYNNTNMINPVIVAVKYLYWQSIQSNSVMRMKEKLGFSNLSLILELIS